MEPRLLDRDSAAAYLGISPKSLELVAVTPIRIGRRSLYDRRALDAWLDRASGLEQEKADDDAHAAWVARGNRKAAGGA